MTSRRGSIHWFKKHAEFLKQESTTLSNDSNYREIHQSRDNLFLSHGNIVVRLNEVHRHPVLIVYPDATPYQLPLVFPLQEEMNAEEVTTLSRLDLGKLYGTIKPKIKFYHHLRHQNSGGVLCFLERADLDGEARFYGISTILKRLRDWYAGHVTARITISYIRKTKTLQDIC